MIRIRIPTGLAVPAGIYRVGAEAVEARREDSETGGSLDLTSMWDDLRKVPGVEIECPKHSDRWWPTSANDISLAELTSWRCPMCAWEFREGLKGRGGTPQY